MNPARFSQMMKYLTRAKKADPSLPDVFPASKAPIPPKTQNVQETEAVNQFMLRNPRVEKAGGGMLVQPSADGSRPGYAVSKTDNNKYRVTGERGGVNYSDWARENDLPIRFSNKKEAEAAQKKFYKSVAKKTDITKEAWTNEMTSLTEKFNKMVLKDFEKGDMSKTPRFATWLKSQKLKNAGAKFFETRAPGFGLINVSNKKFELADILINRANDNLKHTEWMNIQKKLSPGEAIDTRTWRNYIDRLDTKANKANKAFDYLLDNDIELKLPKNLSKTMAAEGSLLRKVISDITGIQGSAAIRNGLSMNDAYNKNIDQIKFANQGNLWTQGEGRTLSEILDNADYRMKGNISWTSDIKLSNRANKNVFDYALRNFNYHQLNKTGEGTIQFYDKKTNKPIDWNTLPKNKNGFRVLKPNSVYFIDAGMPNKKWNMTSIDADNLKWSKGKGSSGLFDEVFQAKDQYDKLLATKVNDPRNPKNQISFGKLMSEVYQKGFDNFGNPYAIEHADGVANNPFKNLKIASQRVNSALSSLNRDTKLSKSQKNKIFKELQKNVFNPSDQNMINNLIKSTQSLQSDVLVKKQTFKQSELTQKKANILSAFCNSRKKLNSGSGSLTCSMEEIQTNMKKQINEAARASKDGKIPKRFGKLRAVAGGFFGDVALPLEYLFMAPDLVAGDIEGALRSSTAGLFGAGKVDLEKLPPGEGKKYIRHTNAITNFLNNYQSKLIAEEQLKNLKPGDEEQFVASDQLAQAEKNMADIVTNYRAFGYNYAPEEKGLLEGKVAAQKLIRDKVTSDFDKKIDKGASTEFFKDKYRETGDLLKENLRSLGGDPFTVTPINNLEDYIKNKGEATAGNTNILFNRLPYTLEQAEAYGVPDIFNTYAGGYAGVETPGSMEKSQKGYEIDMGIKDVRDAYSSLPINMASQLAALEKKELEEGMLKRRLEDQLFAGGGIAKLAGVSSGVAPVSGPNPQGLLSLKNRVRNY